MINTLIVKTIAKKEFTDTVRDNWTYTAAAVFAVFSVGISYFGMISRGQPGLQSFDVTVASLSSLVIYVVPVISLLLGYSAISGEREKGSLAIILSNSLTRGEVVLGKYVGLALALMAATVLGFGAAGILIFLKTGIQGWVNYVYFMVSALALGLVFLSIGILVSVVSHRKNRAALGAIFIWFFFTFLYDSLVLGVLVVLGPRIKAGVFSALLLLNPGDVFRLINLGHLEQLRLTTGLSDLTSMQMFNGSLLVLAFAAWIVIPLIAAIYAFKLQDL